MAEDVESLISYRMARAAARRVIEGPRSESESETFEPEIPDDVARLRAWTVAILEVLGRMVPDEVLDLAIEDVFHGRPPGS